MQPGDGDPELLNHFSILIYPFLHGLTARRREGRLETLAERWDPWWRRLTEEEATDALDGSGFFLPYVQGLLFPETACLRGEPPGPRYLSWVGRVQSWAGDGLVPFARRLPAGSVLRLTCRPELRAALAEFTLTGRRGANAADLAGRLDWADAVLFPSGVGFLLLRARLAGERPRFGELIGMNAALRLVLPPSLSWELARLRFRDPVGDRSMRELLELLTRGLVEDDGSGVGYPDTEAGRAYGERCHLFSYACVHLDGAARAALPGGAFPDGEDRLLYEYAACIGLGQSVGNPVWVPAPEQAERVRRENRLAMWRCWRGMALKESCVFLGTEDLGFNRRALPHNAEHDYLPLYLYTLYQKYRLLTFADGLMHEVAQAEGHLRGARALLRRFVAFRNRFWFSEVTRRPQGGDLYRLLQQALEVPRLYEMVTTSVKEAKEYYEERWDRQVRVVVTVAGLVGGPLAAVWGAARLLLAGPCPAWAAALLVAAVPVVGLAGVAAYLKTRPRGRRRSRGRRPALSVRRLRLHWPGKDEAPRRCA